MLTLSCGPGGGSCPHQHPRERARWALVAGGCWPALAQSGSSLQGKLVWGETTLEVKAGTGNSEMSMSSHPKVPSVMARRCPEVFILLPWYPETLSGSLPESMGL